MDQPNITLIVGAQRFQTWVGALLVAVVWIAIARQFRRTRLAHAFIGMGINAAALCLHQLNWWLYHTYKSSQYFDADHYHYFMAMSFLPHVLFAVGTVLVLKIPLQDKYGDNWLLAACFGLCCVWAAGMAIGAMWISGV